MQTLKEKAENLKDQLQELAKTASKLDGERDRDSETTNPPLQHTNSAKWAKWNKGWGKYGKT